MDMDQVLGLLGFREGQVEIDVPDFDQVFDVV